ncbi:hypothetical protein SLEP1_g3645 [Rubroshorea leprosula]|uniref:Uncharacterized protein n=1 Tax=Rubroshorea leprosula TaxID=152421 RepID=A0AAV5HQE9_9ROSI|nr:hypothetical protein SLEP1_g3645 [Rubroshorea leprosula]
MATSASTLGKEPMSSSPPNLTIVGASGTKPFVLNVGVATVQSNDQVETQVVKSITEDEDKAIKAKARCEYHSGGVGHDLENCLALRHHVQDLIEAKELQIASEPEVVGPNITKNPLPTHNGSTINMIEKDFEEGQEVAAVTLTNQVSSTPR